MREPSRRSILVAGAAALALANALIPRPGPAPAPPRPVAYAAPVRGDRIDLPALSGIVTLDNGARPTFLHFYNPGSPGASESLSHLAELMAAHPDSARFVAIVQASPANVALARRQLSPLGIPVVADHGGRIAHACGVHATPRAVIFDALGRLYFRGRYGDVALPAQADRLASTPEPAADPYASEGTDTAAIVTVPDDSP